MTSRRNFLAKIFSSAIAAPAVAGIIERGGSKTVVCQRGNHRDEIIHEGCRFLREYTATELPDAACVGVTGCAEWSWHSPHPLRLDWHEASKSYRQPI